MNRLDILLSWTYLFSMSVFLLIIGTIPSNGGSGSEYEPVVKALGVLLAVAIGAGYIQSFSTIIRWLLDDDA